MKLFQLSPKQKRNWNKIIPFGLTWFVFGLVYALLVKGILGDLGYYPSTGNVYEFTSDLYIAAIGGFMLGLVLGAIEVLFFSPRFRRRTFGQKILIKTILYVILIYVVLIFLTVTSNSVILQVPFYHESVFKALRYFITDFAFISIVIYVGLAIVVTLFVSEVSDNLGQGVLKNFLLGKYHNPIVEARIFMFLDMKSSTAIAEKLGHVQYFKLLNSYYADMTESIVQTSGEIYQYVGDEIIVSWTFKYGLKNSSCLQCFFGMKDALEKRGEQYRKEFGLTPEFKAGLHIGNVTTGEIGVVKKEIMFTGDVLNTTARIQGSCNTYGVDILISDQLHERLKNDVCYKFTKIAVADLRGKELQVTLFTVSENACN